MDLELGPHLRVEMDGALAILTLDDAATLNAITVEVVEGILRFLNAISKPESGVRAAMITGAGRAFSSGLNLRGAPRDNDAPVQRIDTHFNPLIRRFRTVPVPIVAALNGPAVGIGATMALVCDNVVASRSAYVYFPFTWGLGVLGDAGVSWILPRLAGWGRARRLFLLSEKVPAETAVEWGLVDEVWDDGEFKEKALERARRLATGPTLALGKMRPMLWAALENSFEDQLRWEVDNSVPLLQTDDCAEAFHAFRERRPPEYRGR